MLHGGDLLGVLVVQEHKDRPLSSTETRLFAGLAEQAGPVLHGARLRAELGQRLAELSMRAEELRTSRLRLVEAQDAERRVLERDIHDGAQQHLVALAVNLRLAETLAGRSRERADALLAEQEVAAAEAIAVLMALSRGIYPAALGADGLVPALEAAVGTSAIPVEVVAVDVGRYAADVEATAYFCCLEAVQNAAKHSGATAIRVLIDGHDGMLTFLVEDDGVGFDPATTPAGTGLSNLRDRIESAGGTLTTETTPGGGTRIRAALPARPVPAPAVMTGPSQLGPSQLGSAGGADVRARIAWVLTAITFVLVVADVVVTAQYRSLLSEDAIAVHGFPFVDLAVLRLCRCSVRSSWRRTTGTRSGCSSSWSGSPARCPW